MSPDPTPLEMATHDDDDSRAPHVIAIGVWVFMGFIMGIPLGVAAATFFR